MEYEYYLSIIIVNYNVKFFLEQCLLSVQKATLGMEIEIFVVDNHSSDGSVTYLKSKFPNVIFIENNDNPGFSKANNQAIKQAKGEYIVLLNPDTLVGEELFRDVCYRMDENERIGALGLKMLDGHGRFLPESKRSFPSPWVSFCKLFSISKLAPKSPYFARYSLPYLDQDKEHEVEVLAGAFMAIRHKVLDQIGLLDENFFMYGEDIDLSYRIRQAGYINLYYPKRVLHYKGESTKHGTSSFIKTFYGAMGIFYRKHYAHTNFFFKHFILFAIRLPMISSSFVRLLGKGKRKHKVKHEKMLIISNSLAFSTVKAICSKQIPSLQFINHWNLDEENFMDVICRRIQMKQFTDIAFYYPDVRFDQMLLLMDKMTNKKITYHIFSKTSGVLVSPGE